LRDFFSGALPERPIFSIEAKLCLGKRKKRKEKKRKKKECRAHLGSLPEAYFSIEAKHLGQHCCDREGEDRRDL
jgi:hypothetical protein